MHYDHFEREILEYQGEMRRRAERRRILWTASTRGPGIRRRLTTSRLSHALISLSKRLSSVANSLSNRLYAPPAHLI